MYLWVSINPRVYKSHGCDHLEGIQCRAKLFQAKVRRARSVEGMLNISQHAPQVVPSSEPMDMISVKPCSEVKTFLTNTLEYGADPGTATSNQLVNYLANWLVNWWLGWLIFFVS